MRVASCYHIAEWATPRGGSFQARGTCVHGNIFVRMEWNSAIDLARGGVSESCRTSRLHLALRIGRFRPAEGVEQVVHVSVCTFPWLWSGIRQSILPEVVYQRVVVQVASTWHSTEWAISPGRRCRAGSTCVRVHISVVMEWNSTIDLARGAESESCRTSRLHLALSRVGDCARPKVSSR